MLIKQTSFTIIKEYFTFSMSSYFSQITFSTLKAKLTKSRMFTCSTRMHSSRMCTARSSIVSPYLIVFHACTPPPGATTHAPPEQPCIPQGATMHAPPEQPHMPPRSNHACPLGTTMHAPQSNHTCPLEQPRMPPPEQPCMLPQSNHTCPPRSNHTSPPEQPCMPPGETTHAPPPCEQNDKQV